MPKVDGRRIAVPVVCLLAGLLFATSRNAADGYDLRGGRTTELSGLVRAAEARVAAEEARLAEVRAMSEQLEAADAGSDARVRAAREAADALGPTVGLTEVSGPGLTVTLTDAPRGPDGRYPAGVEPDALVVHQQDMQSVLNALWAGGAEAVSVADQRLLTTSTHCYYMAAPTLRRTGSARSAIPTGCSRRSTESQASWCSGSTCRPTGWATGCSARGRSGFRRTQGRWG